MSNELSPLHKAAIQNNFSYLMVNPPTSAELLSDFIGNTPLLLGIAHTSVQFVLDLLNAPDITQVNTKAMFMLASTPLILSVSKGWGHKANVAKNQPSQSEIILKLLQKGANTALVDAHGRTALHYACLHRNIQAITCLVEHSNGDLWKMQDNNGQTPLDYCCYDYETASSLLAEATRGSFTLANDPFNLGRHVFYSSLSQRLTLDGKHVDAVQLQRACEFNENILNALTLIKDQLKRLYNQYPKPAPTFDEYVLSSEMQSYMVKTYPSKFHKINALLALYCDLRQGLLININSSTGKPSLRTKPEKIRSMITMALKNPDLVDERPIISRVGVWILNLVSLLCFGLPWFLHYKFTGQFFFSRERSNMESLLNTVSNQVDSVARDNGM